MKSKHKLRSIINLFDKTNTTIIVVSIFVALILFAWSSSCIGIWHEFLIDLSASMLAIGITILLVDMLREYRLEGQYKEPRSMALKKIIGINSTLALTLTIKTHKYDNSILQSMMKSINGQSKQSSDIISNSSIEAFQQLAKLPNDVIVSGYTNNDLINIFKPNLQNIRDNYNDINNKYAFSFRNVQIKTDFSNLLEHLDSVIGSIGMVSISQSELEKLLIPADPKKPGKPMTANSFVGTILIGYLKSYNDFVAKYNKHEYGAAAKIQKKK